MNRRHFVRLGVIGAAALAGSAGFAATRHKSESKPAPAKPDAAAKDHHWAEGDMVLGKADAPVTVIEYASMTCPHCARFELTVLPKVQAQYIDTGKVKLIFREYPLDAVAVRAAMLARCAGPERYFGVLQMLFQQQEKWATAQDPMAALQRIGELAGIDKADFDACMADKALTDRIVQSRLEGEKKYKIESTPSFIVGDKVKAGELPFEEFQKLVDPLLAKS